MSATAHATLAREQFHEAMMAEITAKMVKDLRDKTGAGMMDCKKALTETDGDMEAAVDWLRAKGFAKAAKKAGRTAADGLVGMAAEDKGRACRGQRRNGFRRAQRAVPADGRARSPSSRSRVGGDVDALSRRPFPAPTSRSEYVFRDDRHHRREHALAPHRASSPCPTASWRATCTTPQRPAWARSA